MRKITDPGKIGQNVYDDAAYVKRVAESANEWTPQGAISTTAKRVNKHRTITVYNPTNSAIFIKFGNNTVTAPTNASNGYPVLAGEKAVVNSGESEYLIASGAGAFYYTAPEA